MGASEGGSGPKSEPAAAVADTQPATGERPPGASGPGAATGWSAKDLPVVDPNRYTVDREFARGGMGRILAARDRRLGRPVAVKELLSLETDPSARFIREAVVTARLQHPAIVPIYDAGRWPTGEPFYAMKLVAGRSLSEVIAGTSTLEERLALLPNVVSVCEAIAYAHSEGVIHRDLKPANVLVGDFGETVVIDWGLAKDLRDDSDESELLRSMRSGPPARSPGDGSSDPGRAGETIAGSVMGTPAYMPPEQARGEPLDYRADVYALGAILYHLLAGAPAYQGRNVDEILDAVVDGPPPPLEEKDPRIPRELRTIVRIAMAREKDDRYPTAKELAEELRRFQTGQLVAAHDYSRMERARKWLRRNRFPFAAVTILVVLLAATAWLSMRRIVRESRAAAGARRDAERKNDELTVIQARTTLEQDPTAAIAWLKGLSPDAAGWDAARVIAADAQSRGVARHVLRAHAGGVQAAGFVLSGASIVTVGEDRVARVWDAASGQSLRELGGAEQTLSRAALSPDGKTLVAASNRREARDLALFDLATGTRRVVGTHEDIVTGVVVAPGGDRALTLGGELTLWTLATGDVRLLAPEPGERITAALFGPAGAVVVAAGDKGGLYVWPAGGGGGKRGQRGTGGGIVRVALTPDGARALTIGGDGLFEAWELAAENAKPAVPEAIGEQPAASAIVVAKDGKSAVTVGGDRAIVWTLDAATLRAGDARGRVLLGHADAVLSAALSPDGRRLATGSADRTVRLWELGSGEARVLRGHDGAVTHVAFSPDGSKLLSGADDAVRVWDLAALGAAAARVLRGHEGPVTAVLAVPDGRTIASAGSDGTVRLWNLATAAGRIAGTHEGPVNALAMAPRGRVIASAGADGTVGVWQLTGAGKRLDPVGAPLRTVDFAPSGERIAAGAADGALHVFTQPGGQRVELGRHAGRIDQILFSPDGRTLAARAGGAVSLWDRDAGGGRVLTGGTGEADPPLADLAFSTDGQLLAAAGEGGTIRVWDQVGDRPTFLRGHDAAVRSLDFAPSGQLLASGGDDRSVRLWNARTGRSNVLRGHAAAVTRVLFAADGRRLASAGLDGAVRLWDLVSNESRVLTGGTSAVTAIAFTADDLRLACAYADGTLRVFADDLPTLPRPLRAWLDTATTATITGVTLLGSNMP